MVRSLLTAIEKKLKPLDFRTDHKLDYTDGEKEKEKGQTNFKKNDMLIDR